ncbi:MULTISPECIES: phage Gp37/Gp68 family protein [unclassified Paraburkholderia]|uniref:phage Gp37/Gp68 family protein n=1 Tax=unclassified Paraburkholderia TaxID=2615204 RepID=UPI002AAF6A2A|nr:MULTISPECIES: phage Gp37/Gp68 family protein [unclassified Paraburkholderia]
MAENSSIEWTDHTFSPWIGCAKVSPGCDHCYAEQLMDKRLRKVAWGPSETRLRTSSTNWRQPLQWNAAHATFFAANGRRQRVFCSPLADVFDNAVDPAWRVDLFRLIAKTPNLDWMLLTKRVGNARAMLNDVVEELSCGLNTWDELAWPGVWIGATIVDQNEADRDIPKLLQTPAHVKFLSMEPLLGPVDIGDYLKPGWPNCATGFVQGERYEAGYCGTCAGHVSDPIHDPAKHDFVDWVIVGGESGPHARPMHPAWAEGLRDQCADADVPFLFKQWGEWASTSDLGEHTIRRAARPGICVCPSGHTHVDGITGATETAPSDGNVRMLRVGKKAAGRLLAGRGHHAFPITGPSTRDVPMAG